MLILSGNNKLVEEDIEGLELAIYPSEVKNIQAFSITYLNNGTWVDQRMDDGKDNYTVYIKNSYNETRMSTYEVSDSFTRIFISNVYLIAVKADLGSFD